MRLKIAAGNWKMNKGFQEGLDLAKQIKEGTTPAEGTLVILGVPFIHLQALTELMADSPHIKIAAQNCHHKSSGAYTGEVSVEMLRSIGVSHVIIGHSERRQYAKESNELLAEKVSAALEAGLTPLFCCGESLAIRQEGWHLRYVTNQLSRGLFNLTEEQFRQVIIAYEPIWAIGTGLTASPEQAQEMHGNIRNAISQHYGAAVAADTSILYGGSVKPSNATELFSQPDVDGGLVGGASLKSPHFIAIIDALPANGLT